MRAVAYRILLDDGRQSLWRATMAEVAADAGDEGLLEPRRGRGAPALHVSATLQMSFEMVDTIPRQHLENGPSSNGGRFVTHRLLIWQPSRKTAIS